MRVLLHACCGPCLLEPIDDLSSEHEVTVAYANPNIHPAQEYEHRRDTLIAHCEETGVSVVELDYDPADWMRAVSGHESDPAERCRRCYLLRMSMVAESAKTEGYDAFATTLTISPYQDEKTIREVGEAVSQQFDVAYLHQDYRERYRDATRRSRELGMYRQNYCGCLLSDLEAREQRSARSELRQRRRKTEGEDGCG